MIGDTDLAVKHWGAKTASYIIQEWNDSYMEALSGKTGRLVYGGSHDKGGIDGGEFSDVINAVIGKCVDGDSIYIRKGQYLPSVRLAIDKALLFFGDGYGTELKLPDSQTADEEHTQILYINSENVTIQNLRVNGNAANNADAIEGKEGRNIFITKSTVKVKNCWIENARTFGVSVLAEEGETITNTQIKSNTLLNNEWNHIQFSQYNSGRAYFCSAKGNYTKGGGDIALNCFKSGTAPVIEQIDFIDNFIDEMDGTLGSAGSSWIGVKLEHAKNCLVKGNLIRNVRIGVADDSFGEGDHTVVNNQVRLKDTGSSNYGIEIFGESTVIKNNRIFEPPTNGCYGILLENDSQYCLVKDNRFVGGGAGWSIGIRDKGTNNRLSHNNLLEADNPIDLKGAGEILKGNLGFKTENLLENESVGTSSTTIAHGLAVTPNRINVIPRGDAEVWRSADPDATNIYLQASSAVNCDIYVSKE